MKVLIINLTRMGDVIQTFPTLKVLKQKGYEIHYLALSSFSKILKNTNYIDKIHTIEDKEILPNLPRKWKTAFTVLEDALITLEKENFDTIISPIASKQSSYLTTLIPAKEKNGMLFNEADEQVIASDWSAYHLANEHHLGDHCFNLTDIFAGIAKVDSTPQDFDLICSAEAKLKQENIWKKYQLDNYFVIGFHIGASRSNKAWEPIKFKTVIQQLLQDPKHFILLYGGYAERELNALFQDLSSARFLNLIEQTNIDEMIGIMKKIDLFVTNDTGPMHIAAACKRKIINLSLGPVSHWETAAYIEDCIILKAKIDCHPCAFNHVCEHLNCHQFITAKFVVETIEKVKTNSRLDDTNQVQLFRTQLDCFHKLHAVPAAVRCMSAEEYYAEGRRYAWGKLCYDKAKTTNDYISYLEHYYEIERYDFDMHLHRLETLQNTLDEYLKAMEHLLAYASQNMANVEIIRLEWSRVKQIKMELYDAAKAYNKCFDFFLFAKFKESSLDQNSLHNLLRQTIDIYRKLNLQLMIFSEFLRRKNASYY